MIKKNSIHSCIIFKTRYVVLSVVWKSSKSLVYFFFWYYVAISHKIFIVVRVIKFPPLLHPPVISIHYMQSSASSCDTVKVVKVGFGGEALKQRVLEIWNAFERAVSQRFIFRYILTASSGHRKRARVRARRRNFCASGGAYYEPKILQLGPVFDGLDQCSVHRFQKPPKRAQTLITRLWISYRIFCLERFCSLSLKVTLWSGQHFLECRFIYFYAKPKLVDILLIVLVLIVDSKEKPTKTHKISCQNHIIFWQKNKGK